MIARSGGEHFWLISTRAASVNQPGSKTIVGIGAFNLVNVQRKST